MKKSTLIQTIGAVIIVILLLVVAFLLGKGSSNTGTEQAAENATKSEAAATTETTAATTAETSTTTRENNNDGVTTYTTDFWGRPVAHNGETGKPLGKLAPKGDRCKINPEITIQDSYNGINTLWSKNDGASKITEGIPTTYARTATGAALAGWNYRIFLFAGGSLTPAAAKHIEFGDSPNMRTLRKEMSDPNMDRSELYTITLVPEAVRVLSCKEDYMVIEMAHKYFGDENGKFPYDKWDIMRFSMMWRNDDWVYDFESLKASGEIITNIDGWTRWQY